MANSWGDVLPDLSDEFRKTFVPYGPLMFLEDGREEAAKRKLRWVPMTVEAGFPEGCMADMEEILLGECFGDYLRVHIGIR